VSLALSIVLPCYNEADNLPPLLARYAQACAGRSVELILVNNGSTDHSAEVLARELARPEYAFARSVNVEKNVGYGHGIMTGLRAATGEYLAFSHADQQCAPEDVFAAFDRLHAMPDPTRGFVKGLREWRDFNAQIVTTGMSIVASTILLTRLTDINAQPKVFHRSHLDRLPRPPDGFPLDVYVLYQAKRAGLTVATVPVVFGKRGHGQSKWAFSFVSRWRTILNMMRYIVWLRFHPNG
jgi:glycosyltransferase involved in cell wall biosynthesis